MSGIVDTGTSITIMGEEMFKPVAATAKVHKRDIKPADKTPCNYNHKPFSIDGKLKLKVTFLDLTMKTDSYVKMNAHEPLLVSDGVCRQLGIVTYHTAVDAVQSKAVNAESVVLTVRVQLVKIKTQLARPDQSVVAEVRWKAGVLEGPMLLEANPLVVNNYNINIADILLSET